MKRIFLFTGLFISLQIFAQDSTMNELTKDMGNAGDTGKGPVKIFNSQKTINANTTEVVGKGKMEFKVTHNFSDIAGDNGGIKSFFGLDNAEDVRIGFIIGLCKNFDLVLARAKGTDAGKQQRLWEMGFKYKLMQQLENDPSHPLSVALFANVVAASNKASGQNNTENNYHGFSDRLSETFQLIVAKKMGKVSLQLNPTLVTRGYAVSYDQKSIFALGGAIRVPLSKSVNLIVDYFHPFHNESSKDSFNVRQGIKFHDPLGVGFEILTAGHVFHLNFTNATEILENRFIPRTTSSWGKGQFRWGFTISRTFVLWREKK
jgi:Membrane bound beta barrel domain (DUF5777)